jgi:hypothetical protein
LCPDHRLVGRNVPPAGGGLKRRIHVAKSDEHESLSEERESISDSASEDVEAHGLLDRPVDPAPEAARDDEGDDVEAHNMTENLSE